MSRVLVVGSGIAGISTALRASARHEVVLVTKAGLADGSTARAQGGIAAALAEDDSPAAHVRDTVAAGAGLVDLAAARALCGDGAARMRELAELVRFDTGPDGGWSLGREAAHSCARILHAGGDATGAAVESSLLEALARSGATVAEHTALVDVVVRSGSAVGIRVVATDGNEHTWDADAVVLATGGAGALYAHTTNPAVSTGDGVAAAWRAGAEVDDLEFYQFHPTVLAVGTRTLVTEAVRGEGAVLLDSSGRRFMPSVHPLAELAPRDVVARAIARQMAAQSGAPVLLDARALGGRYLVRRFPTVAAACRDAGIDWGVEPVPVTPAAHYWMGGVATDLWGRTSIPGLYAVGETACTRVHGANRLASNSLLEGLVFAERAVRAIDGDAPPYHRDEGRSPALLPVPGDDTADSAAATEVDRAELQRLMWHRVGIQRSGDGLREASARLASWRAPADGGVPAREDRNLLLLARLVAAAALAREESRGAHFRTDFPDTGARAQRHRWAAAPQEALAC